VCFCFRFFARYCGTGTISRDLEQIRKLDVIDMSNLEYLSNMAGVVVCESDADKVRIGFKGDILCELTAKNRLFS